MSSKNLTPGNIFDSLYIMKAIRLDDKGVYKRISGMFIPKRTRKAGLRATKKDTRYLRIFHPYKKRIRMLISKRTVLTLANSELSDLYPPIDDFTGIPYKLTAQLYEDNNFSFTRWRMWGFFSRLEDI